MTKKKMQADNYRLTWELTVKQRKKKARERVNRNEPRIRGKAGLIQDYERTVTP